MKNEKNSVLHLITGAAFVVLIVLGLACATTPSAQAFAGWYSYSDPDSTVTNYSAGESFTPPGGYITLYAKWKLDAVDLESAKGLANKLVWLQNNTESGGNYTLEINANERITHQYLFYKGKSDIVITLKGVGTNRIISPSFPDVIFIVGNGVTFILDNNITLQGRCEGALVTVGTGKLIMNTGSVITGNSDKGVEVWSGTFIMNNGTISGNDACGVCVRENGNFTMNNGTISGNKAGGVLIFGGTFNMSGGYVYGTDGNTTYSPHGTPNTATTNSSASIYVSGTTAQYSGIYGTGSITTTNSTLPDTPVFTTADQLATFLSEKSPNTPSTSYNFKMNVENIYEINNIKTVLNYTANTNKYISLDLSVITDATMLNSLSNLNGAFYGCTGLTSVTLPNGITTIGAAAFSDCTNLTSITIPNSVTSIRNAAFSGCTGLTSVTLPTNASFTSIQHDTFLDCTSLTSITIPNSVISIEYNAFKGCSNLTSITIPKNVTSIGDNAFNNCTKLTTVIFQGTINSSNFGSDSFPGDLRDKYLATTDDGGIGTYTRSSGGTTWTKQPFTNMDDLKSYLTSKAGNTADSPYNVKLNVTDTTLSSSIITALSGKYVNLELTGSTLTGIGDSAFMNSDFLIGITIPNSVTSIGQNAFRGTGLTSIIIPDSVTSIGQNAFLNCTSLTSVTISNNVTSIEEGTFQTCNKLTSVTIGNKVTSIGENAFINCSSLTSVTIPNSVTSIGEKAFQNCSGLTSLTIGNKVSSIGASAFYGCNNLSTVKFEGTIPSSGWPTDSTYPALPLALRSKFYETNTTNGTAGTYNKSGSTWLIL